MRKLIRYLTSLNCIVENECSRLGVGTVYDLFAELSFAEACARSSLEVNIEFQKDVLPLPKDTR